MEQNRLLLKVLQDIKNKDLETSIHRLQAAEMIAKRTNNKEAEEFFQKAKNILKH